MSDDHKSGGTEPTPKTSGGFRVPRRTLIVWLVIFCGIILLMLVKDRLESQAKRISQHRFEELVDSGNIVHATINYDPQSPELNEVVGAYSKTQNGVEAQAPFRTTVRLTR